MSPDEKNMWRSPGDAMLEENARARRKKIKNLTAEISKLRQECPHFIEVPPDFYEKLKTDKYHSASAICMGCGQDFGWFCPVNPKHICNYEQLDGSFDSDSCVFCGLPDERK